MPEVTLTVATAASGAETWSFVEDMDHWAPFLTGYQSHRKLDERKSLWTVKGELGGLTRNAEFEVRITEWTAPERVEFELEGLDEPFTGSGSFRITAVPCETSPPVRRGWCARIRDLLARGLLRRLFGRRATPAVEPRTVAPATQLQFTLALEAGGRSGPVLNLLLAPMLPAVASDLASRIVADLDRQAASSTS